MSRNVLLCNSTITSLCTIPHNTQLKINIARHLTIIINLSILVNYTHCTTASCNGFITSPSITSKSHIVHAALRCGTDPERLQNNINDPLGGENISPDDGRVVAGIQDRPLRDYNLDRGQAALVATKTCLR